MRRKPNQNDFVYSIYKPFRNQIRHYNLLDSLFVVWGYSRNLTFDLPFPDELEIPFGFNPTGARESRRSKGIPEFELDFLLKEFIINCHTNRTTDTLKRKKNLSHLVNYLRKNIRDELDKKYSGTDNVFISFNRMAYNQLKWQLGHNQNIVFRYYKLYSDPILSQLIEKQFKLTPYDLFILGFVFYRLSGVNFLINPFKLEVKRLTVEKVNFFIENFSMSIDEIKKELIESQQMNENLLYSFNPLHAKPIIRYNDKFLCPLQMLLFWQITDGIYYRIVNESGFENSYGRSFERYIGEVIQKTINNPDIGVYEEQIYGREEKRTCDWIIYDKNAILFIECKTKRTTMPSKTELDVSKGLEKDLKKMASFICQIYKTYLDYTVDFYPNLKYDEKRLFVPLVLTLEEWYINYNFKIQGMLHEMVIVELETKGMETDLLQKFPYQIRSSDEFEKDIQIINDIGLHTYFDKLKKNELHELVQNFRYKTIFDDEFEETFIKPLKN